MLARLTYNQRLRLALVLRTALFAVYAALAVTAFWILKDYALSDIVASAVPYGIPPLLSLVCAAFLSVFALNLERIRTETLLFSFICLSLSGLNLDILLLGVVKDVDTALAISRFDHFFLALIQMGASLHLIYRVCEKKTGWWIVYTAYAAGGFIALLTPTDYYLSGMHEYYWGFFARQGIAFSVINVLWMLSLFYCIGLLVHTLGKAGDSEKKDMSRYILYGMVCSFLLSLSNIPALYGYEIYPLGTFTFIPLILITYGLYKYHLRLALQQVQTIFFHVGRFILVFTAGLAPALILPDIPPPYKLLSAVVIITLLHEPLGLAWGFCLERFFKRSPKYLRRKFYDLTYQLSGINQLKILYRTVAGWLFSVFFNSQCAMVFFDEKRGRFTGWGIFNPGSSDGLFPEKAQGTKDEKSFSIKSDHPVIVRLLKEGHALVTASLLDRWISEDKIPADESDWILHAGCIVPILYRSRLYGILVIGHKINDLSYSKTEKEILTSLGLVLGPIIENAVILLNLEEQVKIRTRALNLALKDTQGKNRQIAAKNELITRQNHINMSLFETVNSLHDFDAFDKLFSFVLSQLRTLFPDLGFAILLEGGRTNITEKENFEGLSEKERESILENRSRINQENAEEILAVQGGERGQKINWILLPMTFRDSCLGKMIIRGAGIDPGTVRVISIFLAQVTAVAQNKLLMQELEITANTDGLTGTANRAYFENEHAIAIRNARRFKNFAFTVLAVDINGLKTINDNSGHRIGDEVINEVAGLLKSVCRQTDMLCRIGGDEFAILLPSTRSSEAKPLLKRIREQEKSLAVSCRKADGTMVRIPIRFSIGMAGSNETEPDNVLKLADDRMYLDKGSFYKGKGRWPEPDIFTGQSRSEPL